MPLFFGRLDYATDLGAEHDETPLRRPPPHHRRGRRRTPGHRLAGAGCPGLLPGQPGRPDEGGAAAGSASRGALTAYEDEDLIGAGRGADAARVAILQADRAAAHRADARHRATIEPDQDVIVRAGPEHSLCVQGAPGTGKTAVGLHRAAYLLYAYPGRMPGSGSWSSGRTALPVLHPRRAARPRRDRRDARRPSSWPTCWPGCRSGPVIPPGRCRSRATPGWRGAAPRALGRAREPADGSWSCRAAPGGGCRPSWPRGRRSYAIGGPLRRRPGDAGSPDRARLLGWRRPGRPATTGPTRRCGGPGRCGPRWTHLARLTRSGWCCGCCLTVSCWPRPPRGCWPRLSSRPSAGPGAVRPASARWSPADAVLVDEASDLIERTPSLAHVVLDEAQDLSPMMLARSAGGARPVGHGPRRPGPGHDAVVGARPGQESLAHLGQPDAVRRPSSRRLPRSGARDRLRGPAAARSSRPSCPRPTRSDARRGASTCAAATTRWRDPAAAASRARASCRLGRPSLIPDALVAERRRALGGGRRRLRAARGARMRRPRGAQPRHRSRPTSVKGLEFDHVVLLEPAPLVAGRAGPRSIGLRRLYVCLTRAVTTLAVVHASPTCRVALAA